MRRSAFFKLCLEIFYAVRTLCPVDTGNMKFNAMRFRIENDKFIIEIDEIIAPYVFYTIEKWISPRWNGRKNPNEGWFERGIEFALSEIANKYGARIVVKGA